MGEAREKKEKRKAKGQRMVEIEPPFASYNDPS